jgi:hypothetical protein
MVLFKIALIGTALAAALFLLKQQHVFQRVGVVGSCTVISAPAGEPEDGGQWWSCRQGGLTGFPSLTRDSCESRFFRAGREIWYCPAPLEQPPGY